MPAFGRWEVSCKLFTPSEGVERKVAGADMAEKHSLYLYVSVFQSVVKLGRFSAYRCLVHAAAHLRKVRRKRPEIARLRKVERVSVRSELRYSASEAHVWKSHLRKVMRKGRKNAHLRKVERASVRSELRYGASEAHVWKSHLRKVMRKGWKNAHLRKEGGGRRGRVGQDRV